MKLSPKYLRPTGEGLVGFSVFREAESVLILSWTTESDVKVYSVMAGSARVEISADRAARHVCWQIENNILMGDVRHLVSISKMLKRAARNIWVHSPQRWRLSLSGSDYRRHQAYRRLLSQGWVYCEGEYYLVDPEKYVK